MAKYITLDGLSTFLGKLKDGSYRATDTNFGAIKVVGNRADSIITVGTSSVADRYYGVELDKNGKAFVSVPWADTTYTFGTGLETSNKFVGIKYDNKTLFAGANAKDSSITNSYNGHPLQLGQDHEWVNDGSNLSNLNNFVEYGIYNIFGQRTRHDDNLPIMNTGGGHTFQGRLLVYDSSLPNTGNAGDDCCITQVLTLSNRVGGDGNTYIRTGVGSTKQSLIWETWGKLQTNVEVGQIPEQCLDVLIDNGIYSGVISYNVGKSYAVIKYNNAYFYHTQTNKSGNTYTFTFSYHSGNSNMYGCSLSYSSPIGDPQGAPTSIVLSGSSGDTTITSGFEVYTHLNTYNSSLLTTSSDPAITFVLITVNGYAAASQVGAEPQCTQLLYGISVGGTVVVKKRIGVKGGDVFYFGPWEDLGGVPTATSTSVGGIKLAAAPRSEEITTTQGSTAGRYYGVEIDSSGKAFVNVPWTNVPSLASQNTVGGIKSKTGMVPSVVPNNILSGSTFNYATGRLYAVEIAPDGTAFVCVPWTGGLSTIPAATTSIFGGIKLAAAPRSEEITTTQGGTTAGRYYGVELDKNGKAFVNVPWTGGLTEIPTTSSTKLGGIKIGYTANGNNMPVKVDNNGNAYVPISNDIGNLSCELTGDNNSTTISVSLKLNKMIELSSTQLTDVQITGFETSNTNKVSTYGLIFNANSDTKFSWPTDILWADGDKPTNASGGTLQKGLYEFIITYTPNIKQYTATFAKYTS